MHRGSQGQRIPAGGKKVEKKGEFSVASSLTEIKAGYLYKSPPAKWPNTEKPWKRRFFVLNKISEQEHQLKYFRSAEDRDRHLGEIDLSQIMRLYISPQNHPKWSWVLKNFKCSPACVLFIKTAERDYFLVGENSSDVEEWFTVLFEALKYRPHRVFEDSTDTCLAPAEADAMKQRPMSDPPPSTRFRSMSEPGQADAMKQRPMSDPPPSTRFRSMSEPVQADAMKQRPMSDPPPSTRSRSMSEPGQGSDYPRRPYSEPVDLYDHPRSYLKQFERKEPFDDGTLSISEENNYMKMYEAVRYEDIKVWQRDTQMDNDFKEFTDGGSLVKSITKVYDRMKTQMSTERLSVGESHQSGYSDDSGDLNQGKLSMDQSAQMEMKSMDQTTAPPPGDKGTIPLHGDARPVTESLSSLELQDEADLSLSFSGLRMEESASLPRSHSLPSLSRIPSLENKTGFGAKCSHSVNYVTLLDKTQTFTPDIIVVENKESYRFHCTHAGLFRCSVTGLGFKMEKDGEVTYRTVPWGRGLLSQLGKKPAGPLFKIKGSQGSVCQLHFPHCEILSTGRDKSLSVVHVMDDDGFELIQPHTITETHVIIDVTGLSLFGIIMEMLFRPGPVQALVPVFYKPPIDDDHPSSTLKVLLLPRNVVLDDVKNKRRELVGEEIYIEKPPCKLVPNQEYTLSTSPGDDSIIIEPERAAFEVDEYSYHNYVPTFVINLKRSLSHVELVLNGCNTSECAWKGYVDLATFQHVQRTPSHEATEKLLSVRSGFINSVSHPILNQVLDKLFEKGVIIKEEYDEACAKKVIHEKARLVIDTVRGKGTPASLKLMFILRETDPFLSEDLGLM